jgi:hypothetical protein
MRLFLTWPTIFRGCIADSHKVLCQRKLLQGIWCVDPDEELSPSHAEVIERVMRRYPERSDDNFVTANRVSWLS